MPTAAQQSSRQVPGPFSAALDREAPHGLGYDAERFTALTTARSDAVTMFGSMPTPQ
jgi:hypothetical protein